MQLTIKPLDSILGPASERYFGSRYAKVTASVSHQTEWLASSGSWVTNGIAKVHLGRLWSKKQAGEVLAHVSTVDVASIALQIAESLLAPCAHSKAWKVVALAIGAPSSPVEDGMDRLPFTASAQCGEQGVRVEVRVGGFTVRADLGATGRPPTLDQSPAESVYGEIFRRRVPMLELIEVKRDALSARVSVPAAGYESTVGPLDSDIGSGLNMIDAFVTTLQLGQVLLYELDGFGRAESDTLWMRTTLIEANGGTSNASDVTAWLEDARLRKMRGENWRLATVRGDLPGMFNVICSVAHRLPDQREADHRAMTERNACP